MRVEGLAWLKDGAKGEEWQVYGRREKRGESRYQESCYGGICMINKGLLQVGGGRR